MKLWFHTIRVCKVLISHFSDSILKSCHPGREDISVFILLAWKEYSKKDAIWRTVLFTLLVYQRLLGMLRFDQLLYDIHFKCRL